MSTLQILCPNGRRQNVKINPNTKLLQVLEEVCQKQKFLPAEDYKLIHGRNTVDLTLSVRYANLSNNAKLELVKSEKSRAESDVVIALQLESGERLQHTFQPATSLWDVLMYWDNAPDSQQKGALTRIDTTQTPSLHPVCIYMREEVIGEIALKETKLRTLGLTGGKAVFRLIHRPVEEKTLSEIKEKIDREKQRKAKLEKGTEQKSQDVPQSTSEAGVQTPPIESSPSQTINVPQSSQPQGQSLALSTDSQSISLNINVNIQSDNAQVTATAKEAEEPKAKVGRLEKVEGFLEPMEVEHQESETAMDTEEVQKAQADSSSSAEDPEEARRRAQRESAEQLRALNIPGVEIFTPDDFAQLTPEQQQVAQKLAEAIMPRLGLQTQQLRGASDMAARPKQKKPKQTFAEFKFPEESKGKKLYENELSSVKKEDFQPCDRQTIIYSLEENILPAGSQLETDLPDDFFEVTESDIKKMLMDQKRHLDEIENQPLLTSAMRQARLESAYSKYDRVVIRVQFHDKLVLQGLFRPRETVFAVHKFVKEYLEDKSMAFYLYTAPPKCVLKDVSQTLLEARLVPASVVYFGSDKQQDHYLSEAVLSEVRPRLQAEKTIAECLGTSQYEDPGPVPKQPSTSKGKQPASTSKAPPPEPTPSTSGTPSGSASQSDSKPVPKWFKIGKK